ncbi:hypothetical protein P6P90_04770 [Ectobacillus antri]|uniref:XkdX family protein n=1 Tax=Ectobacillus antri TaxID=2486280 RepID=A0ABT6H3F1_9BACI|nr:hypothetical protein [Ectobacillus antri]MDG4655550.1 hypothetical protein [Ectobacillus antri]MDG5753308.1 hypothetical protein [Ectobacillus antri]
MTNNNKMTADQLLKAIDEMDNGERIKLFKILAVKHYGRELTIEEIAKLNYEAMYGNEDE